jgi:hypothetical protein
MSSVVVKSSLKNRHVIAVDQIDEPVLFVNPSGPTSSKDVAKRLWLANPVERIPKDVLDKPIDPLQRCLVPTLPEGVVVPPVRREDKAH